MNRAALLLSVLILIAGFPAAAADAPRKPNIVFILADDLGYGELGCYGQKEILTPNIDRFAREGLRFTDAYAGATVCAPSRCSLMTGLHGGHARIRGNKRVPLQPQDVTVADLLKRAGYATALCGKWGLGQPTDSGAPNKHGFDYFFGYADQTHAHNYYPAYLWKNDQKFPLSNVMPEKALPFGQGVALQKKQWSHDLIAAEALNFIRSNKDRPFFLYFPATLPHANNEGKKEGMEVPSDAPYSDKSWPQPEKNKAAMITRLDTSVGQVMSLLKELNLDEDTLIIFASDNGPHNEGGVKAEFFHASGPLRGIKRDMYEGGIRVPFIARWPGHVQPNTTTDFITAFWDFLPTAAEIAGVAADKVPAKLDGQSILPTLLGKEQKPHDYLYFEFHERGFDQAVRFGDWKAVRVGFEQPIELYNLKEDLGEKNNVAAKHPDLVKKAQELMSAARADSPDFPIDKKLRPRGKEQPKEDAAAIDPILDGIMKLRIQDPPPTALGLELEAALRQPVKSEPLLIGVTLEFDPAKFKPPRLSDDFLFPPKGLRDLVDDRPRRKDP
jgi:arylsulfatase A-like enzyme